MVRIIQKIINKIIGTERGDDLISDYITKNAIRLLLLHGFSLVIGFVSNFILVKTTGVGNYGSYVYVFNLLYLLAGFCILGVDTLLVKKIPVYENANLLSELKGVIIFSIGFTIIGSIIIAAISGKIAELTKAIGRTANINWFVLAFPGLLFMSLTFINQASLQGFKKIFLSQVTEKLIKPLLVIGLVSGLFYWKKEVNLNGLIWVNMIAVAIAWLITSFFHQQSIGFNLAGIKARYIFSEWTYSAMAFFLLSILAVLNSRIGIFFLGLSKDNSQVGVYNIVSKISEAISFVLVIVNFVLSPIIAKLFSNQELEQLQKLITRSARLVLLFSLPLFVLIILFRRDILLFFGAEFLKGQTSLVILCSGQLINILCGSVGTLLIMTGQQRFSIISLIVSTVFNIGLNVLLTAELGMAGTAIAAASSLVIWNGMMLFFVKRKINIRPTAFGFV